MHYVLLYLEGCAGAQEAALACLDWSRESDDKLFTTRASLGHFGDIDYPNERQILSENSRSVDALDESRLPIANNQQSIP